MTDKPILFSGPMVRAILDGRKTMTRRIIKPQPIENENGGWSWEGRNGRFIGAAGTHVEEGFPRTAVAWSRIQTGDRLWCREAWHAARSLDRTPPRDIPRDADIEYAATARSYAEIGLKGKLRPGIFLPRWASRLTLYVTEVRVERLNSITEAGAIAEGILHQNVILDVKCYGGQPIEITADRYWNGTEPDEFEGFESASEAYADLWDQINGTGAWAQNPWVARYSFKPVLGNIDALPATLQEEA